MSTVVVAMSGGVDSAVAAAVLKEQGDEVIGIHMRLHDEVKEEVPRSCCGQRDAMDARAVCEQLGIPFYVTDYRKQFQAAVIDNFVSEFKAGRTPIPCVACNGVLKFNLLLKQAETIGCDYVATGHWVMKHCGSGPMILEHWDPEQDQSYFLFSIKREKIPKIYFPLIGFRNKEELRAKARTLDLPVADKLDSQDICFVPDRDHKKFLTDRAGAMPAEVVDEDGTKYGDISNALGLTIGQRRGLGVDTRSRILYVSNIAPGRVTVTQDTRSIKRDIFTVKGFNWQHLPDKAFGDLAVRVRHKAPKLPIVEICGTGRDEVTIRANAPVVAVPGQAAVIYSSEGLLGGGWIT